MSSNIEIYKACAKVNLTLEVIGRREDGYHEIASVMQAIALYDMLSFQPDEQLSLVCDVPELNSSDNLVIRAAEMLRYKMNCRKGARISLQKGIPWGSGLGGGSSDAAVTLKALNYLWELHLSLDELHQIASDLGSDINFFLQDSGTVLAEGRGEKTTPLPSIPNSCIVLLRPPLCIPEKTGKMYAGLDPSYFTQGYYTERLVELVRKGSRIAPSFCYNVFENVAFKVFSELEEYWKLFQFSGVSDVHLVGAGPTLFTIVEDKEKGEEIRRNLCGGRAEVYIVETLQAKK
jgi:4-diphosphocytidyl-2-C-methyl-D-erythritol kinase